MSTENLKKEKKKRGWSKTAGGHFQVGREERCDLCREERCDLCRGELYPGDPYFELEDRVVCEYCLGRYAKGYFAAQLRHVGRSGQSFDTV